MFRRMGCAGRFSHSLARAAALAFLAALLPAPHARCASLAPPRWVAAFFSPEARQVGLRWSPVAGAEAYRVLRGREGDADLRPLASVADLQLLDREVEAGATYRYRVQALSGLGESPPSEERQVVVPARAAEIEVTPPSWRKAEPEAAGDGGGAGRYRAVLKWSVSRGAIGYNLFRRSGGGGDETFVGFFASAEAVDGDVEPGVTYRYSVTAVRGDFSETDRSLPATVAVPHGPPEGAPAAGPAARTLPAAVVWQVRNRYDPTLVRQRQAAIEVPFDVAYDAGRDRVYVTSVRERHVAILRGVDGSLVGYLGPAFEGEELRLPLGLGLDRKGNLHVVDQGAAAVLVLSPEGKLRRRIAVAPRRGEARPRLIDVAVDATGRVFVTDSANSRVIVFDERGRALSRWGSAGWKDGELKAVATVAVTDRGEVAVGDGQRGRIAFFKPDGRFVRSLPGGGKQQPGLTYLSAFADIGGGVLLAADLWDNSVKAFSVDPAQPFLGTLGDGSGGDAVLLLGPVGIAGGGDGTVFVSEGLGARVTCLKLSAAPPRAVK